MIPKVSLYLKHCRIRDLECKNYSSGEAYLYLCSQLLTSLFRPLPFTYADTSFPFTYADTGLPFTYADTGFPFTYADTGFPFTYADTGFLKFRQHDHLMLTKLLL